MAETVSGTRKTPNSIGGALAWSAILLSASSAAAAPVEPGDGASSGSPRGREAQCAQIPVDDGARNAVVEATLTPGAKFAPGPPASPAQLEARQKAEAEQRERDWANLCRYRTENAAALAGARQPQLVFAGDSITENWILAEPAFFDGRADRGISGQTTPQILLRFYQDVVGLRPRAVHIMAGTNDIAGNTGPVSDEVIVNNIRAMIDIARANGIRVILASILPAKSFFWRPGAQPAQRIRAVNAKLRRLAGDERVTWVDYYAKLADANGGLGSSFSNDGVHPNRDGYAAMRPLAQRAIAQVLQGR